MPPSVGADPSLPLAASGGFRIPSLVAVHSSLCLCLCMTSTVCFNSPSASLMRAFVTRFRTHLQPRMISSQDPSLSYVCNDHFSKSVNNHRVQGFHVDLSLGTTILSTWVLVSLLCFISQFVMHFLHLIGIWKKIRIQKP